jgi:prophage antirepressor-like protein
MSTDLVPINISHELVTKLGAQFNPVFSQIRIYGTVDEPLFIAKDVEKALGLADLNIRHKTNFKEGLHYQRVMAPTTKGLRETIALTEFGLYQAFFNSSMPVAEEYCRFIVIVMKQLRTQGVVTLEGALKQLQEENHMLEARAKMLDEETDRQHETIRELEEARDRKSLTIEHLETLVAVAKEEADVAEAVAAKTGNVEYVALLERALMKTVYVHVSGVDEDEAADLPDNDVYFLRLSTKPTLARHHLAAEIMMVNPTKQITMMGPDHECSLTDLREMIETSNMAYLKSM